MVGVHHVMPPKFSKGCIICADCLKVSCLVKYYSFENYHVHGKMMVGRQGPFSV